MLDALTSGISEQEQNTAGITRRKNELKEAISQGIMPIVDALQLHAALTDDAELPEESNFTRSDFAHGCYSQTATNAEAVLDLAEARLGESLADYGLAPEDLSSLRSTVEEFRGLFGRTRARINEGRGTAQRSPGSLRVPQAPRRGARWGRGWLLPAQRAPVFGYQLAGTVVE